MFFVVGLGYGDEGKGSIIDFLTDQVGSKNIVRYNGGPQSAHHVVHNGRTHCFSQFGSSFNSDVNTYLSKHMLVDLIPLAIEEYELRQKGITNTYERLYVDSSCILITPMQRIVGQMRELSNNYGSCGMGIGETVRDRGISLRISDLQNIKTLHIKLDFLWRYKLDHAEQLVEDNPNNQEIQSLYRKIIDVRLVRRLFDAYQYIGDRLHITSDYDISSQSIFEGAQGVLLDIEYGFSPYVTKTNTTFDNAYTLVSKCNKIKRLGVLRAYSTRHGAGPFVSEDLKLTHRIPDLHNGTHEWQGKFRIGWLDILASRYALEVVGGVDNIALTNLDRLQDIRHIRVCTSYEYVGDKNIDGFFDYEIIRGRKIIHKIRVQEKHNIRTQQELTSLLFECKPIYTEFKNWDEYHYLSFLESDQGLATPISIVSKGPERKNKYVLKDIF